MKKTKPVYYRKPEYFCEKTAAYIFKKLCDYTFNIDGRKWPVGREMGKMLKDEINGKRKM